MNDRRHQRHAAARRGDERADVKALQPDDRVERAFRKEDQRMALLGALHHAPRVALPSARAVPVDELRADAPQQQAEDRQSRASRLITKLKRGGSAAFMTTPSR